MNKAKIEFEESSGNVFADLGLEDAKELQTRGHNARIIASRLIAYYSTHMIHQS